MIIQDVLILLFLKKYHLYFFSSHFSTKILDFQIYKSKNLSKKLVSFNISSSFKDNGAKSNVLRVIMYFEIDCGVCVRTVVK